MPRLTHADWLADLPGHADLPDTARVAISLALVSRGPRKGRLKSTCPAGYSGATAAWQALALATTGADLARIVEVCDTAPDVFHTVFDWATRPDVRPALVHLDDGRITR